MQQINYVASREGIMVLEQKIKPLDDILLEKKRKEQEILDSIKSEEDKLQSESEACTRINGILNHDFGHPFLKLEAKEIDGFQGKSIVFEVQRNGKKAHNLSEGECSLISFCYFLVKIQEDLEQGKQPIIWIDNPISSLDSNHIFFIYSMINSHLCKDKKFSQLFISTHNLEFLKYLKRLDTKYLNINGVEKKLKVSKYLLQRIDDNSTIVQMPKYMSEYATEFNCLFKHIYECAIAESVTDQNHTYFYNFGNNARKFIEIYSYYKLPNNMNDDDRIQSFWGNDLQRFFVSRVTNEFSHCSGVLERGMSVIDEPEMKRTAKAIISKIQEDINQYDALLESIGRNKESDSLYPLNAE
nr:AAA family ATPase [Wohlfahrtiimonas populi]